MMPRRGHRYSVKHCRVSSLTLTMIEVPHSREKAGTRDQLLMREALRAEGIAVSTGCSHKERWMAVEAHRQELERVDVARIVKVAGSKDVGRDGDLLSFVTTSMIVHQTRHGSQLLETLKEYKALLHTYHELGGSRVPQHHHTGSATVAVPYHMVSSSIVEGREARLAVIEALMSLLADAVDSRIHAHIPALPPYSKLR